MTTASGARMLDEVTTFPVPLMVLVTGHGVGGLLRPAPAGPASEPLRIAPGRDRALLHGAMAAVMAAMLLSPLSRATSVVAAA